MTASRQLRYAVVGTGMMGVEHLHALRALPDTSVVALCDPHAASLATARSIVSNDTIRTYQDVEQLVAAGGF
ncbi:MAG: Gfo/Idh/MocA family oxidoreductase, partial [Actinomycetota bacterium]